MEAMSDELPPVAGRRGDGERERADPFVRLGQDDWQRIFQDLAAGRKTALEQLYLVASAKVYGLALWRTGSHDDACDVVQDLYVRLAEQRDRLAAVRDPKAWLLTVSRRLALDVVRRRRRRRAEPLEGCTFLEASTPDEDRVLDAARASELLARLPPVQREAIYLHHFAGCTFSEIGKIAGVPTFTAASRYRLGVKKLRRLMKGV
jgi:RNA polymerase sigma-70 factor (ECF subfamily)